MKSLKFEIWLIDEALFLEVAEENVGSYAFSGAERLHLYGPNSTFLDWQIVLSA